MSVERYQDLKSHAQKRRRGADSQNEITLGEIRDVLSRRRLAFLACVAIGVAAAIIISLILPTRYEAVARLAVDAGQSPSAGVEALAQAAGVSDPTKLQTQVSILQTDSMAWDVIRNLRLDQNPDALPKSFSFAPVACEAAPGDPIEKTTPECRQILIDEFLTRLHVQAIPRTDILEIRYRSRSKELAAKVVNTLVALYIDRNFQSKYQAAMRASTWLAGKLDQVRNDAETAELKYLRYQKETGMVGVDGGQNLEVAQMVGLNQHLVVAEAERIAQEARYRTALTGDPEALVSISQGTTLQALHAEQVALQNQYAQLDTKFGDAYPRVIQVKEQLEKAQEATNAELKHTREKIKNDYMAAEQTESLLRDSFDAQKQKIFSTNEAGLRMAILKGDVDASRDLYEQVLRRLKTGDVMAGIGGSDVTVIDPPAIPTHRAEPHRFLNLAGGITLGALCGIAWCGLLETSDRKISTMKAVAELCPLPGVGLIPKYSDPNSTRLLAIAALDSPESKTAEAYRCLRTALLHHGPGEPLRVILVTGPSADEGTTVSSINLAAVFAQLNRRVLLVDADLRKKTVSRYFNAARGGGLAAVLAGEDSTAHFLNPAGMPNLTILPAGDESANPPDVIDSARMRDLVAKWREEFDEVILDATHVLGQSGAVVLSTMADTTLLVVRAGYGRRQEIIRVLEILDGVGAKVSGAVVTDVASPQWRGLRSSEVAYAPA